MASYYNAGCKGCRFWMLHMGCWGNYVPLTRRGPQQKLTILTRAGHAAIFNHDQNHSSAKGRVPSCNIPLPTSLPPPQLGIVFVLRIVVAVLCIVLVVLIKKPKDVRILCNLDRPCVVMDLLPQIVIGGFIVHVDNNLFQ